MPRSNEKNLIEVEITPEMVDAGFLVLDELTGLLDKGTLAIEVYTAMYRARVPDDFARKIPYESE